MENVYVIKVKTKPALSSLYPSERRYSASTVGGLSFVHFGLGALSLLLGSLALSLQGPILSVACLVPFVTGLLAWRRWYIDRNITIFFYGSLFSLTAAILCFIATMFDIAAAAESRGSLWSFGRILEQPRDHSHLVEHPRNDTILNDVATSLDKDNFNLSGSYDRSSRTRSYYPTPGIVFDNMSNISGYILRTSTINPEGDDVENSQDLLANTDDRDGSSENVTGKSLETIKSRVMSFWYRDHRQSWHTKILLTVNVLVASLLEVFWSALSARIALRGMMNRLPESSYVNGATGNVKLDEAAVGKRKPSAPRPDILDHDRRLSESLQNLTALHGLRNSGPRLPLPESSREFRERVERFLANQAAHRIVEGSCS
ncbi:hypothetical protein K0M31_009688 [Melipona bicolor]|uniref:Uncharacterized protein n=1 Tax=Melipona bicolor TaxID=60889 RepID=A0AA40FPE2_9HYME|nr:hypothetical protein K0M31_009688 [Melipona bicolor]